MKAPQRREYYYSMKKIYFTLNFIILGLLIQAVVWSCTCPDFVRHYYYGSARVEIYDAFDYAENGTDVVATDWKKIDSVILGDKVRVGLFFEYETEDFFLTYQSGLVNACYADCTPDRLHQRDSVLGFDVVTVNALDGFSAGSSIMASVGWNGTRRDSIIEELNRPFFPNFVNVWFEVDTKPTNGVFQLKAILNKNTGEMVEALSKEAVWE